MPTHSGRAGLTARILVAQALTRTFSVLGDPLCQLQRPSSIQDPYPVYRRLQAAGPVHRSRLGYWVVTTHALCDKILRDPQYGMRTTQGKLTFNDEVTRPALTLVNNAMLKQDPPNHTKLRKLGAPFFRRAQLAETYQESIEKIAHGLLEEAQHKGEFDFVADVASPLPIMVITLLLGIPDADVRRLTHCGIVLGAGLDGIRSYRQLEEYRIVAAEIERLLLDLFDKRRRDPRDDVITTLVAACDAGEITAEELLCNAVLLLVAGFETTVSLIGNAVHTLLRNPGQWELLKQRPDLAGNTVEETLRYEPSLQATIRITQADVDVAGRRVPVNSTLLLALAAANRDPAVFADPDAFDITRSNPQHLSFANGIHYCLGAPLARLEGEIALRALAERMPDLRLAGAPRWRPGVTVHGLTSLPVRSGAARDPR
jgi:cytochrome P450